MNIIILFIAVAFAVFSQLYIWHKLLDTKFNKNNLKLYITFFLLIFATLINYFNVNKFIRIIIISISLIIFFRFLFKKNLHKSIITPLFGQLIIMIAETIYAIIAVSILSIDVNFLSNTSLGLLITNFFVALFSIILSSAKFTKKLYSLTLELTDKVKRMQLIAFCFLIMFISNILAMTIYYKIEYQYLLIFNTSMTLICCFIVFYSFKTQNKYNKVSNKYNIAINSLKEYENMLNKYRITNHENKNLLLTVRTMILNKEKDIPKYIDSIVEKKYEDDEKLLFEVAAIPTGGLRATIYSEILKIKDKKIKYSLGIDKGLSAIDLIELEEDTIIDICKIIGVFIDNAIEEVECIKTKNIQINLYIEDNNIHIRVSNNYKGKIELEKLYETGYTTKGDNHGYGLTLVKQIIDRNKTLNHNMEINKNLFSQILVIQYKKSLK